MSNSRASRRTLQTVASWLSRREDLTDVERASLLAYISPFRNVVALVTGKWFANGVVRVPEDQPKIDEAVEIARRAKVDPMSYDSPMSLIEAFKKYKLREGAVNPDVVPELSNKREIGYGITVYDVDDTPEGQLAMRRIVDTHFGEDANPWCLLQGDGEGGVTDGAWDYWQHYDGCEKKVAFENGKLIAFCANEDYDDLWWDRQDKSHDGVPLFDYLIPDDELGRSVDLEIGVYGNVVNKTKVYKGNRQNGLFEEWYANGRLEERSNWKNGKRDGLYEKWKRGGQLTERYNWKNGRRDGLCEHWHDNGQLSFRANYKEDKFDGLYERWHPNGQLFEQSNYNNGLEDGLYEKWDKNGQLSFRTNYKEGKKDGLCEKWDKNGQLSFRENYKDGELDGVVEYWYANGQLEEHSHWKNGQREGLFESWHPNGQLREHSHYKDGKLDGLFELWRDNGQLKIRSNWRDGKEDGLSETLRSIGVVDSLVYDMGKLVSHRVLDDFTPIKVIDVREEHIEINSPSISFPRPKRSRNL